MTRAKARSETAAYEMLRPGEIEAYILDLVRGAAELAQSLPDKRLALSLQEIWFSYSGPREGDH